MKDNAEYKKKPVMPIIKSMNIGDCESYPCSRMNVVKSIVSQIQTTTGMVFKTRLDRPYLYVTRIK